MNIFSRFAFTMRRLLIASILSMSLLSCGGETAAVSAGISGTGIVVGVITAFGSIFVNGVEYEIDNADFDVDGNTSATQQNLAVGMVVRLEAEDAGDGTGTASSVVYDDAVEGPISGVTGDTQTRQFTVLGQTVVVDATSTSFVGAAFANFAVGDVIEVSGFADVDNKQIIATRVELKGSLGSGDNRVEVRGVVSSLDSDSFVLDGLGLTVTQITSATLEDLDQGLADGMVVEVQGLLTNSTTIQATEIEGEDDDFESLTSGSGSLSLQGIITVYADVNEFSVNGVPVDASGLDASITNKLAAGIEIEVEGTLNGGVLIAEQIEFRAGEAKIEGKLVSVSQDSVTVSFPGMSGSIDLTLDSESQLVDELSGVKPFTYASLAVDDDVSIEAREEGDQLVVTVLKRVDLKNEYEVEGVVQAKLPNTSLDLFGLSFVMDVDDGGASYEIGEVSKSASEFFAAIDVGVTKVELQDSDGDGDIDKAEIE